MTKTEDSGHYEAGDTFRDARDGHCATVTLTSADHEGQYFELRWSDMPNMHEFSPRIYVTGDRLIEIIGNAGPISRGDLPSDEELGINDLDEEDLQPIVWADLIPAETVSAYVHPKADGMVEIEYYAWADVWPHPMDVEPRALLNPSLAAVMGLPSGSLRKFSGSPSSRPM